MNEQKKDKGEHISGREIYVGSYYIESDIKYFALPYGEHNEKQVRKFLGVRKPMKKKRAKVYITHYVNSVFHSASTHTRTLYKKKDGWYMHKPVTRNLVKVVWDYGIYRYDVHKVTS